MGCDIHVKTYLWSNVESRYIDMFEVLEGYDFFYERSRFEDIVGDRFYDLFGAFGCESRSNYPELDCLHYGIPEFLKGSTLQRILLQRGSGDFGFVWCILKELNGSILRYNRALGDPDLFYRNDPEDEAYLDYKEGCYTKKEFADFHKNVISGMKDIRKRIRNIRKTFTDPYSRFVDGDECYFDVDKTVFFIWFDN